MDDDLVEPLSKHCDVFRQLGDREPVNSIEAQAIIENIRAEKGHLDDETLRDLHTLGQRSQDRLLRIVKLKRETEAAYTTKYAISSAVASCSNNLQHLRIAILVEVPFPVRVDLECR
jgi:hypothetical protein